MSKTFHHQKRQFKEYRKQLRNLHHAWFKDTGNFIDTPVR